MRKRRFFTMLGAFVFVISPSANASGARKPQHVRVRGTVRSYSFDNQFQNKIPSKYAANSALRLDGTYQFSERFTAGASYFGAQPFGVNPPSGDVHADTTLPANSVSSLAELYANYGVGRFTARLGRQMMNTSWANAADTRLLPVSYQGLTASYAFDDDWSVSAARIARWKSRTSSTFEASSNLTTTPTSGFLYGDVTRRRGGFTLSASDYEFYDIGRLDDVTASDALSRSNESVRLSLQYVAENDIGRRLLGPIQSHTAGASLSGMLGAVTVTLGYDDSPFNTSFHNGGIASPYTYTSDPLFTTSMVTSLAERGSGHAYSIRAVHMSANNRVRTSLSYAGYFNPGTSLGDAFETDADVTYFFTPQPSGTTAKGLSLRDRLGYLPATSVPYHSLINRVQLDYAF